jgi:large subunit ribosomal protein L23
MALNLPLNNFLKRPRVTEKATTLASAKSGSIVTFEIPKEVNKNQVAEAVKHFYKVTPVKVNVVNLPSKNVIKRGKRGVKSGVKKALVYLKKGDNIDFV